MTHIDQRTLSKLLGVSARTIDRLEAEGVIVPSVQGRGGRASQYDPLVAVPACLAHVRTTSKGSGSQLEIEKTRLAKANADKAEREAALHAGTLVSKQQVVDEVGTLLRAVRAAVLSLPRRACQLGVPPEHERLLTTLTRETLTDISQWKSVKDADAAIKKHEGLTDSHTEI